MDYYGLVSIAGNFANSCNLLKRISETMTIFCNCNVDEFGFLYNKKYGFTANYAKKKNCHNGFEGSFLQDKLVPFFPTLA